MNANISAAAAAIAASYDGDFVEIVCEGKTLAGDVVSLVVFAHDTAKDVAPYIGSVWANNPSQAYWSVPLLSALKRVDGVA